MSYWMSKTQKTAYMGEYWALKALQTQGYDACLYNDFFTKGKDILIENSLPAEVKTSTQAVTRRRYKNRVYTYPTWKWNVEAVGTQDIVLILLAIDNHGFIHPFIMPSAWMADRANFGIATHPLEYGGFIAPALNNWAVVNYMLNQRYKEAGQLDMFEEVTA